MKTFAISVIGLVVLGASAGAQTIIGESTYEDNYLHTPPPAAVAPRAEPSAGRANADILPARDNPAPADERR